MTNNSYTVDCNLEAGKLMEAKTPVASFLEVLVNENGQGNCEQHSECVCRWCKALQIIENETKYLTYLTNSVDGNCQTILHHASKCKVARKGLTIAVKVLSLCENFNVDHGSLYNFVNAVDRDGFTALHYASERKNKDLIAILLRNYADINLLDERFRSKAANLVCDRAHKELLHLFNSHLKVNTDELDPGNELMWTVDCDFGPVVGAYENFKETYHQTGNLAVWLRRSNSISHEILLHPVVQIFIHRKEKLYKIPRYISIVFHLLFYYSWVLIAFCGAATTNKTILQTRATELLARSSVGVWAGKDAVATAAATEYRKISAVLDQINMQKRQAFCSSENVEMLLSPTICLLILSIVKEMIVYSICEQKLFYWKHWQNVSQWLLFIPCLGVLFNQDDYVRTFYYVISIFVAMALIQDQLSKFEIFGLYSQIFASGFKNVLRIGFSFMPFITGFTVTFHLLLPMNPEFGLFGYSKIAAMIIGELSHDAVFFPLGKQATINFPWLTKLWFFIFTIAVTMLFQNLVIVSTISDVQRLKSEARAKFLIHRFNDIHVIENILMNSFTRKIFDVFWLHSLLARLLNVKRYDRDSTGNENGRRLDTYPKNLQKVIAQWFEIHKQGNYNTKL